MLKRKLCQDWTQVINNFKSVPLKMCTKQFSNIPYQIPEHLCGFIAQFYARYQEYYYLESYKTLSSHFWCHLTHICLTKEKTYGRDLRCSELMLHVFDE